jgi:hypothetical protein
LRKEAEEVRQFGSKDFHARFRVSTRWQICQHLEELPAAGRMPGVIGDMDGSMQKESR